MEKKPNLYIFIHGIGSNESTWENFIEVFTDDMDFNVEKENIQLFTEGKDVYTFFNYDSPIVNPFLENFTLSKWTKRKKKGEINPGDIKISTHANSLHSFINEKINNYSKINIIAHSMGGLITLIYLLKLISNSKQTILSKINKTILLASPICGSEDSDDIKKFFDNKISGEVFTYAVKELSSKNSQTIAGLNQKIYKYKSELKKLDILYIYGTSDSRIAADSRTVAESFCKEVKDVQLNHTKIKDPNTINDPQYTFIKSFFASSYKSFLSKKERSIKLLEEFWLEKEKNNQNKVPFIILESDYVSTLFSNGIFITTLTYNIKMMKEGKFEVSHGYRPYDKKVKETIEEDDFYKNPHTNDIILII